MVSLESADGELAAGTQVLRRYSIAGKLAQGGMAEVYLARQIGPVGTQKLVVVKRVRPHLANDSDFVGMFVNEARLAKMINHPNVVQIFDLGDQPRPATQGGGQDWFLAMEYLDGRDMLQVGRACRSHNKAVPFDVTARIIADACAGLDHAHSLKGEGGKSLDLVHRDMSPENILITFEGQVKVVDFGIAKASDNLIKTQAGQIKGKLGYVAPEAILGKPIDARADVFAVGATLYLFLSGRPAFSGGNPMEIFERSLKPPTPPKEVNPRVPEALDAICMKALAQDRDKRYSSAGEVRVALDAYLQSTGRPLGQTQLAQFMKILFPADKDPVRHRIDKMLAEAPDSPWLPLTPSASGPPRTASTTPAPVMVDDDKTSIVAAHDLPRDMMLVPDPITIPKVKSPAAPAHLLSMAVGRDPSRPVGMPVAEIEDMTYEDLDLRTLGTLKKPNMSHGEIQTIPPAAPLPRTTEGSASQGMSTAQAISAALHSDEEADIEIVSIPPEAAAHLPTIPMPMPTSARLFRASVDAAAAAYDPGPKTNDGNAADLDLPPPPIEPPGQLQRPGPGSLGLLAPPAQTFSGQSNFQAQEEAEREAQREAEREAQQAAHREAEQQSTRQTQAASSVGQASAPLHQGPALLPTSAGPTLGLKLAMLGFGGLSGLIVLLLILWMSGNLAKIASS